MVTKPEDLIISINPWCKKHGFKCYVIKKTDKALSAEKEAAVAAKAACNKMPFSAVTYHGPSPTIRH